jgi:hypothetical protein
MLKLEDYRTVFLVVGVVGVLLFASPTLGLIVPLPSGEKFSELWVLGPNHMAEGYPYNIKANESYLVYVGVGNHMGSSSYYIVYVKFRNQTEPLPNATTQMRSVLPPLYEYRSFLENDGIWDGSLTFSFDYGFNAALSRVEFSDITINGVLFDLRGQTAIWDSSRNVFFSDLFFELWIYNYSLADFGYHGRFVRLQFNMTAP